MTLVSTRFGRYDLLRPLGKGGMAEVSLARYVGPEGFEKQLVIKRVLPKIGDNPRLLRMFFEEAKIQVSLSHGNLVSVFDFGRVGNDYFIAMEHVHGVDLASLLDAERGTSGCLPASLVAHIGVELCRGLAYVHRRGFVHRDVSPRNVLLSVDGEVKLSDFGLALAVESDLAAGLRGTPAFMSPEQARGERVDARGDLYAVGLVLAEVLLGRRIRAAADDATTLALARAGTSVPNQGPLGAVLARATSEHADDRFATAEDMLSALERELALLEAGRETLVRELAAKVKPLAPRESMSSDLPRTATVATVDDAQPASYFRDDRSADFVDRVLAPVATPRSAGRWRIAPMAAVVLIVTGVLVVRGGQRAPERDDPEPARKPLPESNPPSPRQNAISPARASDVPRSTGSLRGARGRRASSVEAPHPTGSVVVQCTPWCVPYLDAKPQASDGRSFVLDDVPAGRHRVEGRRLDDRQARDVDVVPDQRQTVQFQFD